MKLSSVVEETDDGDINVHVGRILIWILGLVVLCGALTFASWGIGIWTAPWAGRQNVHRIINSPSNIIFQNDHFYALNADYNTDVQNLRTAERQLAAYQKANPSGTPDPIGAIANETAREQSVVTGLSAQCTQVANTYDNDARNYTKDPFLSHNLPYQLDPTTCEVNP